MCRAFPRAAIKKRSGTLDPLAQLNDIQLPNAVHNWPIAPGWWILVFAVVLTAIYLINRHVKLKKLNRIKRQAIALMAKDSLPIEETTKIVKWACIHYFPRSEVANLYGESFALFLGTNLPQKKQGSFKEDITPLLDLHYQNRESEQDAANLQKKLSYWLNHALPPKGAKT